MVNSLTTINVVYVGEHMVIECGNRKIKICKNTLMIMRKYIQVNYRDKEAGGIIIGRENLGNSNLIIEYITEPLFFDKRSRCGYLRRDKKHIEYYKNLYQHYNGIYAYLGEWHTHPETFPNYSSIDVNNWRKIAKEVPNCNQYHIIAGTEALCVWEHNYKTEKIAKIFNIEWKRISLSNEA